MTHSIRCKPYSTLYFLMFLLLNDVVNQTQFLNKLPDQNSFIFQLYYFIHFFWHS